MNSLPSPQDGQKVGTGDADSRAGAFSAYLLSGLFVLLGISAILWLVVSILRDPAIRSVMEGTTAESGQSPSLIIAFLTQFGIVLPVLILGLGAASVWLGLQLRSRDIQAARWAQIALLWLTVGAVIGAIFSFVRLAFDYFSTG